jgi:pimeloyl-ACP methyl ester carboxylesterase
MAAARGLMPATAILIPGNMCDARLWSGAGDMLRRVLGQKGFAVRDANTARDDTIEGMARRALGETDGPLLTIGFSMGAIVALEMARQASERIVGLALFGLNAGADLPERSAARIRQQAEVREGGLERVVVEELKPNYLARANRGNAPLLALLRDMGLTLGPDIFIAQSEALRLRADLRPVLDTLRVPVLLGCGEEDALCPPVWHRDWSARLSDVSNIVFPGAGHMLPLEQPEGFANAVIRWIEDKDLAA